MKHTTHTKLHPAYFILPAIQVLVLVLVQPVSSARARLGETPDQCNASYGKPVTSSKDDLKSTGVARFEKNGFDIVTTYYKGKCVEILFKKLNGQRIETEEVNALLKANKEQSSWVYEACVKPYTQVIRADGRALAMYNIDSLRLTNVAWIQTERALHARERVEHLKDF